MELVAIACLLRAATLPLPWTRPDSVTYAREPWKEDLYFASLYCILAVLKLYLQGQGVTLGLEKDPEEHPFPGRNDKFHI